jgi:orotidine-5'-phosphate decarboxylase
MSEHFSDALLRRIHALQTPCIVGIAPAIDLMPRQFLSARSVTAIQGRVAKAKALSAYSRLIINEVCDLVSAVKFQTSCYERYGWPGVQVLEEVVDYARERGLLVILDANRGGQGSASRNYVCGHLDREAEAAVADAVTVSPYEGHESLQPFLQAAESTGRGVFVSLKSSSPEATLFQDVLDSGGRPVWTLVADYLQEHSRGHLGELGFSSIGVVFSALNAELVSEARELLPHHLFLVRGIGAQGGCIEDLAGFFNNQGLGAIVSSSRSINYPERYPSDGKNNDGSVRGATLDFIDSVRRVVPTIEL